MRLFIAKCPKCGDKFHCRYDELRHSTKYKLLCPFCHHRFFDSESPEIDERWITSA